MKKKFLLGGIAILSAAILLSGCCSDKGCGSASSTKNEITVGATAGPHAQVVEAAAKEAEKHGLTVHVKEFSDYITPDQALADGDIDIAVYQ
ncbi:MetQ/NlpA family ABC transporter substrate-binding protein, partial [Dialister micraerophilus]